MTIQTSYQQDLAEWRASIEEPLRRDWISLVGLFELDQGLSQIGSDPANQIVLPAESAPALLGTLAFQDGLVTITPADGVALAVNGTPLAGSSVLHSDAGGAPDLVTFGSLTFFVIQRGPRTLLRVRDANSPTLKAFAGRRWFPIDQQYLVEGIFTPYDPPKSLAIGNLLGDTSEQFSPGVVSFEIAGQHYQLDATAWRDGGLVLHFRDTTNGELTYGGGRAVVTAAPQGSLVSIDFNRTTNLPCAFTQYATCPLPPQANRLPIALTAGELLP